MASVLLRSVEIKYFKLWRRYSRRAVSRHQDPRSKIEEERARGRPYGWPILPGSSTASGISPSMAVPTHCLSMQFVPNIMVSPVGETVRGVDLQPRPFHMCWIIVRTWCRRAPGKILSSAGTTQSSTFWWKRQLSLTVSRFGVTSKFRSTRVTLSSGRILLC